MTKPPTLRTAIYARVSTLDQDPAMQLRELRAYAAHRRLPITAEFIDQVNGTTADRPALARLWQAVHAASSTRFWCGSSTALRDRPNSSSTPWRKLV